MDNDTPPTPERGRLLRDGSFVVQFSDRSRTAAGRYEGRAEHLSSGAVVHFRSTAELLDFMAASIARIYP